LLVLLNVFFLFHKPSLDDMSLIFFILSFVLHVILFPSYIEWRDAKEKKRNQVNERDLI